MSGSDSASSNSWSGTVSKMRDRRTSSSPTDRGPVPTLELKENLLLSPLAVPDGMRSGTVGSWTPRDDSPRDSDGLGLGQSSNVASIFMSSPTSRTGVDSIVGPIHLDGVYYDEAKRMFRKLSSEFTSDFLGWQYVFLHTILSYWCTLHSKNK